MRGDMTAYYTSAMRVDAHQHFWRLERGDYGWLTPELGVLYRDFGPEDLRPRLTTRGFEASVVVQAAPTLAETRFLLELAAQTDFVAAVVGWVDLEAPCVLGELDALQRAGSLAGVRPMIQDIADPDWMLGDTLTPAIRGLAERGLAFDALVRPHHLSRLRVLLDRHPDLRVVIDHAAKPDIAGGGFDAWAAEIAVIARETRACCKLSGLVTEAGEGWGIDDLVPYADHVLACFGPERVLWGSDWPVCELAGGYARWFEATETLLRGLLPARRDAVLGGNAASFYRLPIPEAPK